MLYEATVGNKHLYNADLRTIQAALQVRIWQLEDSGRVEAAKAAYDTLRRIILLDVGDTVVIKSLAD